MRGGVRGRSPSCRRTLHKEPHTPSTQRAGDATARQNQKNVPIIIGKVVVFHTSQFGCGNVSKVIQTLVKWNNFSHSKWFLCNGWTVRRSGYTPSLNNKTINT